MWKIEGEYEIETWKWKLERSHLPATVTYWVAGPVDIGLVGPVAGDILLIVSNTKINVVTQNNVLFNNHTSKQQVHLILDWFEYLLSAQYSHWMRGLVYIALKKKKRSDYWYVISNKGNMTHQGSYLSILGLYCCLLLMEWFATVVVWTYVIKKSTTTNPVNIIIDSAFASYISVMITKTISVSWVG